MARRTNLRSQNITAHRRQVKTYGTQTPLSSAAVERGSTRWLSGSHVEIQGTLSVTGVATVGGTLSVTGTFNASGQINLSGSTSVTGPMTISGTTTITGSTNIMGKLNVTGPTTLDGDTEIGGLLDITGKTTIRNDLELLAGGKFIAGETTIEPSGKAQFGDVLIDPASLYLIQTPGGYVSGSGSDDITLASSASSSVSLNSSRAELDYRGVKVTARAGAIDLTAPKTWVNGEVEVSGISRFTSVSFWLAANLPTTGNPPNLFINSQGRVYKSTWTP